MPSITTEQRITFTSEEILAALKLAHPDILPAKTTDINLVASFNGRLGARVTVKENN